MPSAAQLWTRPGRWEKLLLPTPSSGVATSPRPQLLHPDPTAFLPQSRPCRGSTFPCIRTPRAGPARFVGAGEERSLRNKSSSVHKQPSVCGSVFPPFFSPLALTCVRESGGWGKKIKGVWTQIQKWVYLLFIYKGLWKVSHLPWEIGALSRAKKWRDGWGCAHTCVCRHAYMRPHSLPPQRSLTPKGILWGSILCKVMHVCVMGIISLLLEVSLWFGWFSFYAEWCPVYLFI